MSREIKHWQIRLAKPEDNDQIAHIIRTVMPEYGAVGSGFSIEDPEVDHMFESYNNDQSVFFVLEGDGRLYGCSGIGPLTGAAPEICELKKMYMLKEARGIGFGTQLMELCLSKARDLGYESCYLETLSRMTEANNLYRKFGFKPLAKPLGNTGHTGCESWYVKSLR